MKLSSAFCRFIAGLAVCAPLLFLLDGCTYLSPAPIPTATTAVGNPVGGRVLLAQCVAAHGGQSAYERLHDVNVRYEGKWATTGPRLQPKLSDTGYRGGSEERYIVGARGFTVGQHHHGPSGDKWVFHEPEKEVVVGYHPQSLGADSTLIRSSDADTVAAALVVDAYSSFLFGPYFFEKRGAFVQKLDSTVVVRGRICDKVLAILRPGLGRSPEDRLVLCIDQQDHRLRRVQFTLEGLESTRGAEVHVDLMAQRQFAGVWWPTQFFEQIERPVNLPAHRWRMSGFDSGRGYAAADIAVTGNTGFKGRAAAPAHDIDDVSTQYQQ